MNSESYLPWGIVLIGTSIVLIFVEVFVPSGGLIAVSAAIAACTGIIFLFIHDQMWGFIGLGATLVLGPMALTLAFKAFPHTPIGRRLILGTKNSDPKQVAERHDELLALLDAEGEAITDLRPVGVVRIDGKRYDALAEGPMIEAGSTVRVVVVEATQIKVRKIG